MSFIEQTAKVFGNTAEFRFRAIMFGRDAFYIEGARPLKLGDGEMIFRLDKGLLTLTGEGMAVKDISGDCVSVVGAIRSVSVDEL